MPIAFEEWVQTCFDHPFTEPEWFWGDGFDSLWESLGLSELVAVNYLTRLFLEPQHLKPYSLKQVAQGIWFLVAETSPSQSSYALLRPYIALRERLACIQSMTEFFRNFVAPAAPGPADTESDEFHGVCYMWWDLLWHTFASADGREGEPELHQTCMEVMSAVLELPSELCRLSALHGLNHWHRDFREEVEQVIDAFLANASDITPGISEYASKARTGSCL